MSIDFISRPQAPPDAGAVGVLVIDDQLAVREGLARLLACARIPLRGIRTAASAAEALIAVRQLRPEVILLDVDLAGEDGLALLPQLAADAGVLVLTSHGDATTRARAMRLGALAFIEKHQPAADLLAGVVVIASVRMGWDKAPVRQGTSSPSPLAASSVAPAVPRP